MWILLALGTKSNPTNTVAAFRIQGQEFQPHLLGAWNWEFRGQEHMAILGVCLLLLFCLHVCFILSLSAYQPCLVEQSKPQNCPFSQSSAQRQLCRAPGPYSASPSDALLLPTQISILFLSLVILWVRSRIKRLVTHSAGSMEALSEMGCGAKHTK